MDPQRLFGEAERQRIAEAAREAERRTSGEIVPYVVGCCDDYDEAAWKGVAFGVLAASAAAAVLHWAGGFWGGPVWLWILAPVAAGAALGFAATSLLPGFRRALIPDETLDLRARRRAAVAFLEEEVFDTADRTGILLFVALFEHRVVVLGDAGIHRAVPDGAWQGIVDRLVAGIRAGRTADALVAAIGDCGALLEKHRLDVRPDDRDELPNELRLRDR